MQPRAQLLVSAWSAVTRWDWRQMLSLCFCCPLQTVALTETSSQLLPPEKLLGARKFRWPEAPAARKRGLVPVTWNYNERCWSSSPSLTWMLLHISVLFLSSPGFLSHSQCWFWSHPGVQTNLRAGPVLQRGLEKIPLSKGAWCFHFPGSRGRRSWGWSSRAPDGQQLCKRGKFIPLYRWEERSIARVSVFLCVLRSPQFTPQDSLCPCVLTEQNWEKGKMAFSL